MAKKQAKQKQQKKEKKKGFFSSIVDKIDNKMVQKSKKRCSCCNPGNDKRDE